MVLLALLVMLTAPAAVAATMDVPAIAHPIVRGLTGDVSATEVAEVAPGGSETAVNPPSKFANGGPEP